MKPAGARSSAATPRAGPGAARAAAPAGEAAPALLIKSSKELAQYMATAGFFAQLGTADKPRLAILAEGVRWHDPEKSMAALAGLVAATAAGKDPDLSAAAVPAAHVQMAAKLMWPWLLKSGFLSADLLSDEWKLFCGVSLLAAPMVPALWKFATYSDKPPADKPPPAKQGETKTPEGALRAVT